MEDSMLDNLAAKLADHLTEAEAAYMAAAGGEAVCQLHKDGRVSGGLKYEEGRVIALRDLQRALRTAQAAGADLADTVATERARWVADLAAQQAQARPLPWVAYAQGGVDALHALTERMDG